jgi:hypothetical protein
MRIINRYFASDKLRQFAKRLVRAAGLEPAQLFRAEGFSYHFGFRRLASARSRCRLVRGLDYTFTIARFAL